MENPVTLEALCRGSRYCPVIDVLPGVPGLRKDVIFRVAGDGYLQVEYGTEQVFDLMDAFRLFTVMERLGKEEVEGLIEFGQGFRTLTLIYDPLKTSYRELIKHIKSIEESLGSPEELSFSSRLIELPMTFEDNATRSAIKQYADYIREDAPNIIDGHNIKYVALYNGLTVDEVKEKLLSTEWLLVHQLFFPGGTYQLPLDPRSTLEAPKYNPVRTYTPEGAVGLGGQCLYVYTTESPGGYQLLGRAAPTYQLAQEHPAYRDRPFLLQASDRIRYVEVPEERLAEIYRLVHEEKSPSYAYSIKEERFEVRGWLEFMNREDVKEGVRQFEARKREAQKKVPVP